jgi:hypothetical protein
MRIAECGMRNQSRRLRLVTLALLLATASLRAQPAGVVAKVEPKAAKVTLAESVRVTLSLEGPAKMRVELPKQLLTADANSAWRIRPEGSATVTALADGREEWRQVYRLDPYLLSDPPGAPLRVTFNPATVNGQEVAWPAVEVVVDRIGGASAPPTPKPIPVTGVEDVPDPIQPPTQSLSPWWFVVAGGVFVAAVLVAAYRRARRPKRVPPHDWALGELAKLEGKAGAKVVERLAAVVRRFIERRFGVPATKLTTSELLTAASEQGWPVEQADALRVVLDECDRVKFAGDAPDDDGCRRLVRLAVEWVNDFGRPAGPG